MVGSGGLTYGLMVVEGEAGVRGQGAGGSLPNAGSGRSLVCRLNLCWVIKIVLY